ncbi:peptidyl-prolyl cis-trans isomerase, partial [Baffinella frigidus]
EGMTTTDDGLKILDVSEGTGATAFKNDKVKVQYSGKLADGTVFDSGSISFVVGQGQVIKGWDQGIPGMKVGGKRKLIIPAALAYGSAGAGGVIPPNAQLNFDVKLLSV